VALLRSGKASSREPACPDRDPASGRSGDGFGKVLAKACIEDFIGLLVEVMMMRFLPASDFKKPPLAEAV